MLSRLSGLKGKEFSELSCAPGTFVHGTCGSGSMLYMPIGCLIVEQTLGNAAVKGIRFPLAWADATVLSDFRAACSVLSTEGAPLVFRDIVLKALINKLEPPPPPLPPPKTAAGGEGEAALPTDGLAGSAKPAAETDVAAKAVADAAAPKASAAAAKAKGKSRA
jgi:hypothetical protein